MRRWAIVTIVYVAVNISFIWLAGMLAMQRVMSPPNALDVVEFFACGGPILLAVSLAAALWRDRARHYEWLLAAIVVAAILACNIRFLSNVYASI